MTSQPQHQESYRSRAYGHSTSCQCGGTGRWLTTKAGIGGEVVTGYGPCPRLVVVA